MHDVELGDEDATRRALQALVDDLPKRPRDGLWLPALALASRVAARLHDPVAADRVSHILRPYQARIIAGMMPHPVVCLGSVSFYLGLLATVRSRWAEAADHFEAAIRTHDRLGARPLLARTRQEYARMLLRRGQPADQGRALGLLEEALGSARAMGMARVCEEIETLRAAQAGGRVTAGRAAEAVGLPTAGANVFRREGEYWTVCYEGSVVRLKDSKGLRHLARLLAHPARSSMRPTWRRPTVRPSRRHPGACETLPGGASWRRARISVMRGSCWTPPPRPPTRPG
jgi:hypothetical protein